MGSKEVHYKYRIQLPDLHNKLYLFFPHKVTSGIKFNGIKLENWWRIQAVILDMWVLDMVV